MGALFLWLTDNYLAMSASGRNCGFITGRVGTLFGNAGTSNVGDCSGGLAP